MEIVAALRAVADDAAFEESLRAVSQALDLFGEEGVAISFNGGKDSTVLLHLLRAALAIRAERAGEADNGAMRLRKVRCIHFSSPDEFKEMEEFLAHTINKYELSFHSTTSGFKEGLGKLCPPGGGGRPSISAILMGQRRTDPWCGHLSVFHPTDNHRGWPLFLRVNPILDWTYQQVWTFLRHTQVEYCRLYDEGYTSIGGVSNTKRNPALASTDTTDGSSHGPAYLLEHSDLERTGRSNLAQPAKPAATTCDSPMPTIPSTPTGSAYCTEQTTSHCVGTAALLIIGEELLSGKVADSNTALLCRGLRDVGFEVRKMVMLTDDVAAIAAELRALLDACEIIITAGGLGPTHDDVTVRAVASALGVAVVRSPELEAALREYFSSRSTSVQGTSMDSSEYWLKMSEVPEGCDLVVDTAEQCDGKPISALERRAFPTLNHGRIWMLPGIPALVKAKVATITAQLNPRPKMLTCQLQLGLGEAELGRVFESFLTKYPPTGTVALGSYPSTKHFGLSGSETRVLTVLTLDSRDASLLREALECLTELLPTDAIIRIDENTDTINFC